MQNKFGGNKLLHFVCKFFLPLKGQNTITTTASNISVSPAIAMPENPFCYFIHHAGFHHGFIRVSFIGMNTILWHTLFIFLYINKSQKVF